MSIAAVEAVSKIEQQLRAEMDEAHKAVTRWTTEQMEAIDCTVLREQQTLETAKENLQQSEEACAVAVSADETIARRLREEESKIEELRKELDRLQSQESLLPAEQQRLCKALEQQRQLLAQHEVAYQQSQQQKDAKLAELDKGCSTYQRLLALEFERMGEERLRLIFTNVDERAPSRAFSFQVFVDGADQYHINQCEPRLEKLPELTHALNQSNDFSAFVRAMRREFKRSTL
mmetsp:Transcript_48850/g.104278  ORF Transcript_48850/g.104278 Transcript_48850/m.104278 type:complete len:233 (-) Transcript_48850:403-1101(-)